MLGDKLKNLRGSKTQSEIAAALNIERASYAHYEQDRHKPNYEDLKKIADYYGVTTDYLLEKSPFKTASEEKYSVTVAIMKKLLTDDECIKLGYDKLIWDAAHDLTELLYEAEQVKFIEALRAKGDLDDVDYYKLSKYIPASINWPDDFNGPATLLLDGVELTCSIDYWHIPKIHFFEFYFDEPVFNFITPKIKKPKLKRGDNWSPPDAVDLDSEYLKRIPLVGRVAAGNPILAIENPEEHIVIDTRINKVNGYDIDDYFALEVVGQSMEPTIHDGEVVLVRKQSTIEPGEIGVFRCNSEEATIKRLAREGGKVYLVPDNKQYPVQVYMDECVCIGKVLESIRRQIK